jgi:hypothetical protein
MSDVAESKAKYRFIEGGNVAALVAIIIALGLCLLFYNKVGGYVSGWDIKIEDVYSYVFNLFAIEFGSLLALFALFVCRPTAFLERMKSTHAFSAIMSATKITMIVMAIVIGATFAFGLIRLQPNATLTLHSGMFLAWAAVSVAATCFYGRTVRLIFFTLT